MSSGAFVSSRPFVFARSLSLHVLLLAFNKSSSLRTTKGGWPDESNWFKLSLLCCHS